jgi:uncharacterized membrane protein
MSDETPVTETPVPEAPAPEQSAPEVIRIVEKFSVDGTIREGFSIGIKNVGSIIVNAILYILTIWIPYLNAGTTIGMTTGIISKASKGEAIPMTEIFDPKYRKYMGEYFLTTGLIGMGTSVGFLFFIIPGIVISLAWSLSLLLVVDKGKNPTEAISISNNCTYGYKWKMVGIYALVTVLFAVVIGLFYLIPGAGIVLILAASVFASVLYVGIQASIYKQLTAEV